MQDQQEKSSQGLLRMQQFQSPGLLYGHNADAKDDEHVEQRTVNHSVNDEQVADSGNRYIHESGLMLSVSPTNGIDLAPPQIHITQDTSRHMECPESIETTLLCQQNDVHPADIENCNNNADSSTNKV